MPAHLRSAAMGDGPDGAPLCLAHGVTVFTQMGGQEAAQRVDDGARLLCGGAVVEIDEGLTVDLLVQNREVGADVFPGGHVKKCSRAACS